MQVAISPIISYQEKLGNYNPLSMLYAKSKIISYQEKLGNYNQVKTAEVIYLGGLRCLLNVCVDLVAAEVHIVCVSKCDVVGALQSI